jgi:hypothetical protein
MRFARLQLRRIATAVAAVGALLLVVGPFFPLAEDAPYGREDVNSIFDRSPGITWSAFFAVAIIVPVALSVWDSRSRLRVAGPLVLLGSGVGAVLLAHHVRTGVALSDCGWILTGFPPRTCSTLEPGPAAGLLALGGALVAVAGVLLLASLPLPPKQAEARRRRLRSLVTF